MVKSVSGAGNNKSLVVNSLKFKRRSFAVYILGGLFTLLLLVFGYHDARFSESEKIQIVSLPSTSSENQTTIIISKPSNGQIDFEFACSSYPSGSTIEGSMMDMKDIVDGFCGNIINDPNLANDLVVKYIKSISIQNYTEAMILHNKIISGELDSEFHGLNLRQFSLLLSFTSRVFQDIGNTGVLLHLPELDSILSTFEENVMFSQRRTIYAVEFSGCSTLGSNRYGMYMNLNLAASIKHLDGSNVPPVLYYTWDEACVEEAQKYPHLTVYDARPLAVLFPWCQRDLDSSSRILLTWELLKRNISIFNVDADVVFFKEFPVEYMDADIAGAMYTTPQNNIDGGQYRPNNSYLSMYNFNNFGQWWWKASPAAITFFGEYLKHAVFDIIGSDPNPVTRWHCDDQDAMARFLKYYLTPIKIKTISCGEYSQESNSLGNIHLRILEPESFPMAALAMRGWMTNNTVTLHMSTYGYWKIFGLRALGLWFLDDNATWSPNGGFPSNKSFVQLGPYEAASHSEERDRLVYLIAYAMNHDLGFVMPSFDCKFTPYHDFVPAAKEHCTYDFHYDYDELIRLNVPFIFENEIDKVFGKKKKFKKIIPDPGTLDEKTIHSCNGCLFELKIQLPNDNINHLQDVNLAIKGNPRVHGCC